MRINFYNSITRSPTPAHSSLVSKIGFLILLLSSILAHAQTFDLGLNWKAEPEFGGFYAAADILNKKGVKLNVIEGGSGTPTIQMLASKKITFGIVSGDELITARDRGIDLVAVFAVYQTSPQGIMVRDDSPWKNLEQLLNDEKAVLAVQMGLPYVSFLKKKYPKMKVKLVPYQGGIGPFLAQKNYAQQAFLTAEPLSAAKAGVKTRGFTLDEVGFNPYLAVVAVHRETLNAQKKQLEPIIKAFREGWELYLSHPLEFDKQMHKINPSMSLETFQESGKAQLQLVKPSKDFLVGSMSEDRWKSLSLQLKDLELIKKPQDPKNYFFNF